MKKIIYVLSSFLFAATLAAQTSTPNGGFETWTTTNFEFPTGYEHSNRETFYRCGLFNAVKTTDAYNGSFALQLTTIGCSADTSFGYIVNVSNPSGASPCTWTGGIPFSQMPSGIRGYYKSNIMAGDSAVILLVFKSGGICLGMYEVKFSGAQSVYTAFNYTFNPPLAVAPDTLIFAIASSDVFNNVAVAGSMIQVDSLSLTGVTQPAALNGNFENWSAGSIEQLSNWYNYNNWDGSGVAKTTDMNSGTYAVELTTYQGDNNGVPRASSGGIGTGYWQNNCWGSNCLKGGYPFTNQVDTLAFYYKYAPLNNDTGVVSLNFKNGGTVFNSAAAFITSPASAYQYMKVGFNSAGTLDSIIVSFQSSGWNDTTLASVGTVLKIDDVHFLSQASSGINSYGPNVIRSIYPNPSNGQFVVENVDAHDLVRVLNVFGQEVNASIRKMNGEAHISVPAPGAYTVYINSRGRISNLKVVVGKE